MVLRGLLTFLAFAAAMAGAAPAGPGGPPTELARPAPPVVRFQRGDDPQWAAKDFDDSDWTRISPYELPSRDGIYWIRARLTGRRIDELVPRDGLLLRAVASYDVYWDGELIGRNGRVSAQRDDEQPGYVDGLFQLPAALLGPGEHVLALRMSSFHSGFPTPTYSVLLNRGNFRTMLVERSRTAIFSVMAVGAALVVAIVFGLMWLLADRRSALLLFSGLFGCAALMQALQAWRWLYEYPYSWHYPRLVVIAALATTMAALLALFVMQHFGVGRRRVVYGVLAAGLTVAWFSSPYQNSIGMFALGLGCATALVLSLIAVWRRKRGAVFACAGLAFSLLALFRGPREFLDHAFFISTGPAVLGLLIALILQLRDERREARQAQLAAARLEVELLKKNIQPHFLLNTLATIQEVIEQDPRMAVNLIDALAAEFRILARVSGEKLIPLAQELELCRAHLHVMSRRKAARCSLNVRGAEDEAWIPPALFHTLIENGLTHLLPSEGRIDFDLQVERRGSTTRYALLARGQRQSIPKSPPSEAAPKEGTGLRYIRARLEESFPGRWTLSAGPVPEGWETVIEVAPGGGPRGPSLAPTPGALRRESLA
ncbi:MAG TPA: histidine kinase [Opitutaceae bacterium]|nr:histidine kinase [Opitutaceae bacterium]